MALLGSGTELDPYLISTVDDLLLISNGTTTDWKHYKMTNDIELPYRDSRFPIASQKAYIVFDGDGYKFTNLNQYENRYNSTSYEGWGIFDRVFSAHFKNVGCEGFSLNIYAKAGCFAGTAGGDTRFENCYVKNCQIRGYGSGSDYWRYMGGFVGYATTPVTFVNCFVSESQIVGTSYSGGFIGFGASHVFENCYSYAYVHNYKDTYAGAFVDGRYTATTTNCYYAKYNNGNQVSNGATLLTLEQLKDPTNLVGFDFNNVWGIKQDYNNGLPIQKIFLPVESPPMIDSRQVTSFVKVINSSATGNLVIPNFEFVQVGSYTNAITSTAWANLVHPNIKVIQVGSYIKPITSSVYADLIQIVRKQIQVVSSVGKIDTYNTRKVKAVKEILSFMNKITGQVIVTSNIKPKQLITLIDLLENGNDVSVIQYLLNDVYMVDVEKGIFHLEDKTSTHHIETKTEVRTMALTGDTVQLQVQFKTFDGNAIEPTNVALKIYKPTSLNTFELLETISLSETEKVGVGEYHYNYTIPTELNASSINFIVYEFSGLYQNSTTLARGKVNIRFV